MSTGTRVVGGVLAVVLTVLTSWASRTPVSFSDPDEALLRLSWRQDGVTVEACRDRTPEELAEMPVHMRNPRACIGDIASYHLVVRLDGNEVLADTVRPAGLRGDRPVYVLADLPLTPGRHEASVTFEALLPEGFEPPEGLRSRGWSGTVELGSGQIGLITWDDESGRLELRGS